MKYWLSLLFPLFFLYSPAFGQLSTDDTLENPDLVAIPKNLDRKVSDISFRVVDVRTETSSISSDARELAASTSEIKVTESDTELKIEIIGDILFDFNKATLRSSAEETLNKIAEFLNRRQVSLIRVEGHTDSVGSADYNQRLSEQRAETVKNWLENNLDIEPTITTVGHGPRKPVAPNTMPNGADNPEGRQKNRRVEIFIPKK
ncbi:MAG: OmpA family protein [Alphaproteobacteria bacterium]|nr:OmpA family protein [Alphaproteobacteria bacterium]